MPDVNEDYALFLDFDGTLVDIVERPEAVVVDPALPDTLTKLEQRLGGALAIISGRPVEFLDGRLMPHVFDMAGLHGLEHRIAGRLGHDGPGRRVADVRACPDPDGDRSPVDVRGRRPARGHLLDAFALIS